MTGWKRGLVLAAALCVACNGDDPKLGNNSNNANNANNDNNANNVSDMGSGEPDGSTDPADMPTGDDGSQDFGPDLVDGPISIVGAVQKGPYVVGSSVTLNALDASGAPTGMSFPTTTMNDAGEFEVTLPMPMPVRIEGSGFYFDELRGELSGANLALRAVFEPSSSSETARVNLVTHLTSDRVLTLVGDGETYPDAIATAEEELVAALGIGPPDLSLSTAGVDVDVTGADDVPNAYALAISALFLQAAELTGGTFDAELQQLLNTTVQDLADNGMLDGVAAAVPQQLRDAEAILPFVRVQAYLQERVATLDPARDFDADPLPDMGHVLDTDDDGVMNIDDVCIASVDPGQEDADADGVGDLCDAQFTSISVGGAFAGGSFFVCGVHAAGSMGDEGSLMCWLSSEGMPNRYQHFEDDPIQTFWALQGTPVPPGDLAEVSLARGQNVCVRYVNGDVLCNDNSAGWQAPTGGADTAYRRVAAGAGRACGITTSGALRCWNPFVDELIVPGSFSDLAFLVGPSAAVDDHMCATNGSTIRCWVVGDATEITMPATFPSVAVSDLATRAFVQGRDEQVFLWSGAAPGAFQAPVEQFAGETNFATVTTAVGTGICGLKNTGEIRCSGWPVSNIPVRWPANHGVGPGSFSVVELSYHRPSQTNRRLSGIALTADRRPRDFNDLDASTNIVWRPW